MASTRAILTLVLALTLGLALPVAAQPLSGPEFIPLMPCRVFDSRNTSPLPGGEPTNITIAGLCGVPPTAVAAALNFTITEPEGVGHLTVFPKNGVAPLASLVNYVAGQTVANAADITLGEGGAVSAQPVTPTDLVVDVYGYFIDVEELAGQNTALGAGALASITSGAANTATGVNALLSNTTGANNTATGVQALFSNTLGDSNTATGVQALFSNTDGGGNTATGLFALQSNNGESNTATGATALRDNTTGGGNTATGVGALFSNTTGFLNTALGFWAGINVTTGSNNIHIGNEGTNADSALIRVGTVGTHTATFIAGIAPVTLPAGSAPVCIVATTGQLGRCPSPSASNSMTGRTRPVSFGDLSDPELMLIHAQDEEPAGDRNTALLTQLQRQQREITELRAKVQEIDELRSQVRALIGGRAAVKE
jgi:hypothetical protein